MTAPLRKLQKRLQRLDGFRRLRDYEDLAGDFLSSLAEATPTRIISPSTPSYIFFQYSPAFGHRITRPLNTDLFIEDPAVFGQQVTAFHDILDLLKKARGDREAAIRKRRFSPRILDSVVYTMQQSLGSLGDSLPEVQQTRKRAGQLFEGLVKLTIEELGVSCEGRVVKLPIPGHEGKTMNYELDMVLSRGNAIVASETNVLSPNEIVGSVKTTSKDRIDKVFLDKFLMSRLLGRDVKVIAIFLHDVQRAKKAGNIFGINSTFKTNHFLGYTIALNALDGVYYVDPRPAMTTEAELARQIGGFSRFLVRDLWTL